MTYMYVGIQLHLTYMELGMIGKINLSFSYTRLPERHACCLVH
jgi:hypothetical protein